MTDPSILFVEDNLDDEELTLVALRQSNVRHAVTVVRDGQEALDYLFGSGRFQGRDTGVLPDVMLLDISLPRVNGLDVLRRVRADERTRHLSVVMLTSSNEERDRLAAYENFANSYVRKPVDFDEFSRAVRELGKYWLLLNQPAPRLRTQY